MKQAAGFILRAVAAAALLWAAAHQTRAQATYTGPTGERTRDENERDLEDRIAYQRLRAVLAANASRRPRRAPDPRLALEQLQEDFTRLQLINKELVLTTSKSPELDLKFVAKSAAEIHKRAGRLMNNLALPEPEDAPAARTRPEDPSDPARLKSSITELGWLIYNFARNPMFKEVDVVEPRSAAEARRSLEEIVALSERIKRGSEKLHKAARGTR